ncbi:hypothetical protein SIN8267_00040 [Sinobacterium norvegicum]|uniref:Uncharacterized protein n=1 Tax=Sinobacterium norvegicum TaxID=1641715 RepID=A0ABM9ABK6_9GAMM|nr:hypothetical protein [Sinobacterium norvegicum]CAH0989963.1 hypothetical protein SIN8267_00040 [Sinobacterium norvegicum]
MAERHLVFKQASSLGVDIIEQKTADVFVAVMAAPVGKEFIYNSGDEILVSSRRGVHSKAYFWSEVKDVLDLGLQEQYALAY